MPTASRPVALAARRPRDPMPAHINLRLPEDLAADLQAAAEAAGMPVATMARHLVRLGLRDRLPAAA